MTSEDAAAALEATVSPHFHYLVDQFGMRIVGRGSGAWETCVTYARDPIAIIVRRSIEFDRVEVEMVRMVDGQLPKVPIFIHEDTPIDRGLFDHAVALRAGPEELEAMKRLGGLEQSEVEAALAFLGPAVQRLASDFLGGDTSLIDKIGRLIRERVAESPQQITVHLPEGTPPREVEQAVAQAKKADPRVPIVVHFYRRPGRRE